MPLVRSVSPSTNSAAWPSCFTIQGGARRPRRGLKLKLRTRDEARGHPVSTSARGGVDCAARPLRGEDVAALSFLEANRFAGFVSSILSPVYCHCPKKSVSLKSIKHPNDPMKLLLTTCYNKSRLPAFNELFC
jgi:hypothetical protein